MIKLIRKKRIKHWTGHRREIQCKCLPFDWLNETFKVHILDISIASMPVNGGSERFPVYFTATFGNSLGEFDVGEEGGFLSQIWD